MAKPPIHRSEQPLSALILVKALGQALTEIKDQDGLTWKQVGAVLRKSADQAAKYASASAEMSVVTYGYGKRQWGSRFTGPFDRICEDGESAAISDRASESLVLKAAAALSEELVDHDSVSLEFVRQNRTTIEAARDALDVQLHKLRSEP